MSDLIIRYQLSTMRALRLYRIFPLIFQNDLTAGDELVRRVEAVGVGRRGGALEHLVALRGDVRRDGHRVAAVLDSLVGG